MTSISRPQDGALALLDELRSGLANAEDRPGQVEMTAAIASTLRAGGSLVVQAPTGTGKSLAYLCAAIASGRSAVVATSSIALQDQLVGKDLPFVAGQLSGRTVSYAVVKGRSNYACRQKIAELQKTGGDGAVEQRLDPLRVDDDVDAHELNRVLAWSDTTETGDRAELDFEPSGALWGAVSTGGDECPRAANCPHGSTCFAERAHERAAAADVVIVNTHLYAMHVASGGRILPEHEVVIFDEAHEVEAIFSSALGSDLSPANIRTLGRATKSVLADEDLAARIERCASLLAAGISDVAHAGANTPLQDLRLVGGATHRPELAPALIEIERCVIEVRDGLKKRIPSEASGEVKTRAERARQVATSLMKRLEWAKSEDDETVIWVEGGHSVRCAPLDVGEQLEEWFWSAIVLASRPEDEDLAPLPVPPEAAIFTSATIPVSIVSRLRVPKATVLEVATPFDYQANAMLYVPQIPDPKQGDRWRTAADEELGALIEAAGGRTLALFTSIAAMRQSAETLRAGARFSLPILVQDDLPKRALLEAFTENEQAVLCGTRSFFHGVDVPGKSLSLVVLDRIPFPRPGDPLIEAWQDAAGGGYPGFARVAIPLAAATLAQAAGRLIRTASDRGVVAVLDSRLATANYRQELLRALPPMKRSRNRADVVAFLKMVVA